MRLSNTTPGANETTVVKSSQSPFDLLENANCKWCAWVITCCALIGCDSGPRVDYSKNSSNIAQHLTYDDEYPFVGFWKLQPSDNFGLAIDKYGDGQYSVWFCGPGGSGEIEMLSPTMLTGDSNFKIIDKNTIEAIDKNGQFDKYMRFQ